jgi:dephospho-CoA kinase
MKKIGLTGGIGCGKSVVARLFEVMGFPVYDSDWHAKQLMQSDHLLREDLMSEFGTSIFINGVLNRQHLAALVFEAPDRLKILNQLVHPAVKTDFLEWEEKQHSSLVFLESAILFESQFSLLMDSIVVVVAPLELRIERVVQRDGVTKEAVLRRMANQWPEEKIISMSDYVIVNDDKHSVISQSNFIISKLIHS